MTIRSLHAATSFYICLLVLSILTINVRSLQVRSYYLSPVVTTKATFKHFFGVKQGVLMHNNDISAFSSSSSINRFSYFQTLSWKYPRKRRTQLDYAPYLASSLHEDIQLALNQSQKYNTTSSPFGPADNRTELPFISKHDMNDLRTRYVNNNDSNFTHDNSIQVGTKIGFVRHKPSESHHRYNHSRTDPLTQFNRNLTNDKPWNSTKSSNRGKWGESLFSRLEYDHSSKNALESIQLLPHLTRTTKNNDEFLHLWWKSYLKWQLYGSSGPLAEYLAPFLQPSHANHSTLRHYQPSVYSPNSNHKPTGNGTHFLHPPKIEDIPTPLSLLYRLSQTYPARVIAIGDVHGCLDELQALLREIELLPGDLVVFLGDLVAKGPRSREVVQLGQELRAIGVRGNHDDEVIRQYHKLLAQQTQSNPGQNISHTNANASTVSHPINGSQSLINHRSIAEGMNSTEINWFSALPYGIVSDDLGIVFVHAGIHPEKRLKEQEKHVLMTIRSLIDNPISVESKSRCNLTDKDTDTGTLSVVSPLPATNNASVSLNNTVSRKPKRKMPTSRCIVNASWAKDYLGPWKIYYGHDAARGIQYFPRAMCTDTGCVYGGQLSAVVLPEEKLVQVPAKRKYFTQRRAIVKKTVSSNTPVNKSAAESSS